MRRLVPFLLTFLAILTLSFAAPAAPRKPAGPAPAPAAQDDAPKADDPKAEAPRADAEAGEDSLPPEHDPVTMKVGIKVLELNRFDLAQGTYSAEFLAFVHCDQEPCKPDFQIENGKIVGKVDKLKDEPLYKELKIKAELNAILDFSSYPFDNHNLPIDLTDKGDPEQINYVFDAASSGVKDTIKLPGWDLGEFAADIVSDDVGEGKKISHCVFLIEAQRPRLMAIFKSVVPVAIMLFVAAFTLLLKAKSASGRLSAATAGLMSIVMFQVGQVGSLPPLGYLTRLDKFMIATYLVYLLNIGFSVLMVRAEEKKNDRLSELMYLAAAGAVPGLALVAWLTVFLKLV